MSEDYHRQLDQLKQRNQPMCGPVEKKDNMTKIEKLIEAIDRLERTVSAQQAKQPTTKAVDPADALKTQIDRLEKLIG